MSITAFWADGHWPAAVVQRVAREAAEGMSLINALRVEPDLGTPFRGGLPATIGRRVEGGWRISGHKIYSTGIPILSWLVVWGRTDEEQPRSGQFLVPAKAPGVRIVETWDHLGMRASGSHDVILENVFIPTDYAVDLRPPAEWATPDPLRTAWFTLLISAIYDGVARAARDWIIDFARTRTPSNLGVPLSTLPRFQEGIGEIEGLLLANRRLLSACSHGCPATAALIPCSTERPTSLSLTSGSPSARSWPAAFCEAKALICKMFNLRTASQLVDWVQQHVDNITA
jgi:alkylation response protein AidB-like acyl-CoA dehydrogenase